MIGKIEEYLRHKDSAHISFKYCGKTIDVKANTTLEELQSEFGHDLDILDLFTATWTTPFVSGETKRSPRFYLQTNDDLEGWGVREKDVIQMEEGTEDSVIATFYEKDKAFKYIGLLNEP